MDSSIKTKLSSAKARLKKLNTEVKTVRDWAKYNEFIQKVISLENYFYDKIDRFYPGLNVEFETSLKELRLDAEHYRELGSSYRQYLAGIQNIKPHDPLTKSYIAELKLASTLNNL